jgi:signal transduction histidine kinase
MKNGAMSLHNEIKAAWHWLTDPNPTIRDAEVRRRSQLFAAGLIILLPVVLLIGLGVIPGIAGVHPVWKSPTFWPTLIGLFGSVLCYGINRSGHYDVASHLYLALFLFAPWLAVYQNSSPFYLPIALLMVGGVLLTSLLTPYTRIVIITALESIVGILLLPILKPSLRLADVTTVLSVTVTLDILIIVLTDYQKRIKQEQEARLTQARLELQEATAYHEERLAGLIEAIVAMSALDFARRAPVSERGDVYDAVATGINALGEELETSVVSRAELEEIVGRRTRQLEEANRELANFAYIASHDLKAPLRAISQLSTWIVEDYSSVLDQDGKEKLGLLIERTRHMHNLIEGILAYSRIGRISENAETIDLNAQVRHILKVLDPPEAIRVEIACPLPVIRVEPTYITQVFQNLISNAIQYMDKPAGLVRIGCERGIEEWIFSVSDNGPGIDPKYFQKIFQIFQTLGNQKKGDSTGIGLALVKRIVEKMGGRVWVESVVGEGSTFYFTISNQQE